MTTEDYVSFETAKLLKEKGFDVYVRSFYEKDVYRTKEEFRTETAWNWNISGFRYSAPTLQMAMKWLREVHNANIAPYALSLGWAFDIFDLSNRDITGCKKLYSMDFPSKSEVYSTYEEAADAAIKYCLENLI